MPPGDEFVINTPDLISGDMLEFAAFVVARVDRRYGRASDTTDSVLLATNGREARVVWQRSGSFGPVWCSPAGVVFASCVDEVAVSDQSVNGGRLVRTKLATHVHGVWGLDEGNVFAWGRSPAGASTMHRWDGRGWSSIGSPGLVYAMHGRRADAVVAGGAAGLIARWDGARWQSFERPCTLPISAVHVVDDEVAFATAHDGHLLEGSDYGWRVRGRFDHDVHGVGALGGEVLVGMGSKGLGVLDGDALKVLREGGVSSLDCRERAVFVSNKHFVETLDGRVFRELPADALRPLLAPLDRLV